ncbi:Polyhydroxyalkanoate depolymerase, intracellular subfamily [Polymorphum gilvum SL003B-26A1]|uniref:Polyhydroxyalkanoate depolymerase, intracellular subfamily n=1 Tax=Polymorphum gilvum (strain LMG 25793 / CGMCC 1.9160 / SL003B-26A1) TaxID=991905 RepID=F2IYF2_POLGS|nr:Polyhydroxyalkanoate depolymerase, intracellular subfamily [Polymorphum gilvum SL003B-26A1]
MPYYHLYELNHAAMGPVRAAADATRLYFQNPFNPLTHTQFGRQIAAACEVLERTTRRYGKPDFGLPETSVGGMRVPVRERIVWSRPFCNLIHFERGLEKPRRDPKLLIVAPMSGHYATLLRGTVEAMLPRADVYITDWIDARMVPLAEGKFDLDDYIDYVISMIHYLGTDTHVIAVCQPSVPVLAAVAVMEERDDPYAPSTMTLMGGPIDTRVAPTAVNDLAQSKDIEWFRRNVIMKVPFPHPGVMRDVYPGFLQLSGFMSMNLDRHLIAHRDFFQHLVKGDGDSAEKHRDFYDEYLAVMDLSAEFYLQTVETVFIEHALPLGTMMHGDTPVNCAAIRNTALLTVEGEKDDITGRGQTRAAHDLCTSLPDDKKAHYEQPNVGHYGVFNGSRFRSEIAPRIIDFVLTHAAGRKPAAMAAAARTLAAKAPAKADPLAAILLSEPRGVADDLKAITGVGPKLEKALNGAGIFHYWQIAALTEQQIDALDARLDFRGRIARDNWIEQARRLTETVG